jgi:hypothetical protein
VTRSVDELLGNLQERVWGQRTRGKLDLQFIRHLGDEFIPAWQARCHRRTRPDKDGRTVLSESLNQLRRGKHALYSYVAKMRGCGPTSIRPIRIR